MGVLEKFQEVAEQRHQYAQEWKRRTGGKVVGYFCTYLPEEIYYAAGVLPVRVLGGHEPQDVTERYIYNMLCPYCRDVLAQGLLGKYQYLDAITMAYSCHHIRQAFDSWRRHVPDTVAHFVYMPDHRQSSHALECFDIAVRELAETVEKWTGKRLTTEALNQAIEVYNLNRRLHYQLYELRKPEPPLISGTAVTEAVLAGVLMDKAEHSQLLAQFLEERRQPREPGPRIMILGSENDDTKLLRFIESLGANIVMDDHCIGSRYFWREASLDSDPLASLADRYLNKPPCPHRDLVRRERLEHVGNLVKDYGVQGVIYIRQKFCDPYIYDMWATDAYFRKEGIPTISLEVDVTIPYGQFRTRIEAFLEMFL